MFITVPAKNLSRLEELERRCRHCAMASAAVAVLWTVLIAAGLTAGAIPELEQHADPLLLFDVVLIAALSLGVRRNSRLAASLLLVYVLITIVSSLVAGEVGSLLGGALALWIVGRATHATFAIHRLRPSKTAGIGLWAKAAVVVGGLILVLAAMLMAVGAAMETGLLPDSAVVPGADMRESTLRKLRENGVLESSEKIVYFYSMGMFSFLEDGNFFTESRVVSYSDLGGERYYQWAYFEDIVEIAVDFSTTSWEPSVVTINAEAGPAFMLLVSTESKKDQLFYDALVEAWKEKRPAVMPAGRDTT